uniref:Uncharacterized protein n=1 Tax=Oryza punctata TaxID=4537 RepID=A0A0E0K1A6_ORYPU
MGLQILGSTRKGGAAAQRWSEKRKSSDGTWDGGTCVKRRSGSNVGHMNGGAREKKRSGSRATRWDRGTHEKTRGDGCGARGGAVAAGWHDEMASIMIHDSLNAACLARLVNSKSTFPCHHFVEHLVGVACHYRRCCRTRLSPLQTLTPLRPRTDVARRPAALTSSRHTPATATHRYRNPPPITTLAQGRKMWRRENGRRWGVKGLNWTSQMNMMPRLERLRVQSQKSKLEDIKSDDE